MKLSFNKVFWLHLWQLYSINLPSTVISNYIVNYFSLIYPSQPFLMKLSDSKLSRSSAYLYRPFTTHTNSPRKIRQNNFLLDCTNRETSTLPAYKPQNDAFNKPYVQTLLEKVKSQNLQSTRAFKIKPHCKIRQSTHGSIEAQKFKSFLAEKMQLVMHRIQSHKNSGFSSVRNSPQKENISVHKNEKNRKDKFLDHKFSSYKMKIKKGVSTNKPKRVDSAYQD